MPDKVKARNNRVLGPAVVGFFFASRKQIDIPIMINQTELKWRGSQKPFVPIFLLLNKTHRLMKLTTAREKE